MSELLEGRTLREEMNGGALPLRKATEFALQIAHGLIDVDGSGETLLARFEGSRISPDGQWLTIAAWEQLFSIMVTDALPSL